MTCFQASASHMRIVWGPLEFEAPYVPPLASFAHLSRANTRARGLRLRAELHLPNRAVRAERHCRAAIRRRNTAARRHVIAAQSVEHGRGSSRGGNAAAASLYGAGSLWGDGL